MGVAYHQSNCHGVNCAKTFGCVRIFARQFEAKYCQNAWRIYVPAGRVKLVASVVPDRNET